MAQSKYHVYDKMRVQLSRLKFQHPASLATFLLDTFMEYPYGKILAEDVQARKLCEKEPRAFTEWRDKLVKHGFLAFETGTKNDKYWIKYEPGKRLNVLLNEEKSRSKSLVTTEMLNHKHSELEARLEMLETMTERIISIIDPPFSKAKSQKLATGAYDETLRKKFALLKGGAQVSG